MSVIVIAEDTDFHADAVVDQIQPRGLVFRISPSRIPGSITYVGGDSFFVLDGVSINLDEVSGIFCRYALESLGLGEPGGVVERYCRAEYLSCLGGLLLHVGEGRWINHPWKEAPVDGKIFPLSIARQKGLIVPAFVVSNSLSDVGEFMDKSHAKRFVIKPLSDTSISFLNGRFHQIPDEAKFAAPFTTEFVLEAAGELSVDATPFYVQEMVERVKEVRCLVVDNQVFCTAALVREDAPVDIRLKAFRDEMVWEPSPSFERVLVDLTESLGLRLAAYDFMVDATGELWLTDVNPMGNWLWQDKQFSMGISNAIAGALLAGGAAG